MWDKVFVVLPVAGYSFPVTVNILSFTGKVYCDTRCSFLFLSQEINFLSQKILFILQEKILLWQILLSCDMGIFHHVIGVVPPITRSTVFFLKFGSSYLCIPFLLQMCGIYNNNFLWDIRISWEPGSLVPRDYPTLVRYPIHVLQTPHTTQIQ